MKVIHRNFAFSIIYNLIVAVVAVQGKINPLFAAILMPMSALTVFLSSLAGTKKMRLSFEEMGQ
jgi:cation transport ATPase